MIHATWWKRCVVGLMALGAVLTLACHEAAAQIQPFKVDGAGVVNYVPLVPYVPVFHFASGNGTFLGRYYGEGKVQLEGFTGPTTADFSSAVPFVFVGTHGDKLACHYGRTDFGAAEPGEVPLYSAGGGKYIAVWVAEFTPVPALCTGRFARLVDGSFTMIAITQPFVLGSTTPVGYKWVGNGWLDFGG